MKFYINANHVPPGTGTVVYLDGKLEGDQAVLAEAKKITTVQRTPHHAHEPMDWSDGELAGQALQTAMYRVRGAPIHISVDPDSYDDDPSPKVTIAPSTT